MPRKSKKQEELDRLKETHYNEGDELRSILIYDKNDECIKNYKYVVSKTKVYNCYYEDDNGNVVTQEAYQKLDVKDKQIIGVEISEGNNSGLLLEAMEYLRVGDDTGKIKVNLVDKEV